MASVLRLSDGDLEEAVDTLINEDEKGTPSPLTSEPLHSVPLGSADQPCSSAMHATSTEVTIESLLKNASEAIDFDRYVDVIVRRDHIWSDGIALYKRGLEDPSILMKDIRVEFRDQEGVDAGALKLDFFESLLNEINTRLFVGEQTRRIPKKDWGLEGVFEVAGAIMAHSLLLGGPAFGCMCPAIYSYILFGDIERALSDGLSIDDIPLDAGSSSLVLFLQKVCLR